MGKTVKTIGIAIAIGAITGGIGGFFAPALTATVAGTTLTGVAAGAFLGAVGGVLSSGLGLITKSFTKKQSMPMEQAIGRLNLSVDPQAIGKFVFGETAGATDIIYAEQHGAKDQYITQIVAAAAHRIISYDTLYVNDETITFAGNAATGDWASTLWRDPANTGGDSQTHLTGSQACSWPSSADGRGMSHYMLQWQLGKTKTQNGLPSRITQVVTGIPVYDPRLDTTRGGSGSHRADDQSTWQYNDGVTDIGANWALLVALYLVGWHTEDGTNKLIFGMGVDPDDIDWDSVMAAANVCDDTVDSKPRFRIGGVLPTTQDHDQSLRQLEASIGGRVSKFGGKYYIWAPNDDLTPFDSISEVDLVRDVGVEFIPSGPIENLFNTARGMYVSPSDLYQAVPYPDVIEATAVTEDGRERVMEHNFSIVQDVEIAERVARMLVRRSRFTATWRFAMGPRGLIFRPFSVTTLNITETNNEDVTVRIIGMTYSLTGIVVIECIEEDSSIYDTTAVLGTPVTQYDPGSFDPTTTIAVSTLAVADTSITGSSGTASDALAVTWDDPGALVARTEVRYRKNGATDWILVAPANVDFTKAIITGVEPGTNHDVQARHITIFNAVGAWSATVNETTGSTEISRTVVDGAIVEAKLGTGAVTETKVGSGAITNSKMATDAITTLKVSANQIVEIDSAFTAGSSNLSLSYAAFQTVAHTVGDASVGGPWVVELTASFESTCVNQSVDRSITFKIDRAGTTVYGPISSAVPPGGQNFGFSILDNPGDGAFSYSLDILMNNTPASGNYTVSNLFLSAKGMKR